MEITGGTGTGFFWPKGNEGKRAAGQVAWGVLPMECSVPDPCSPGRPVSLGIGFHPALAQQQRECAGGRKFHFAWPVFARVIRSDGSFSLHLPFS